MQSLMNMFPNMFYSKNRAGVYVAANRRAIEIVKATGFRDNIIGLSDTDIFSVSAATLFCDHDDRVMTQDKAHMFIENFTANNGTPLRRVTFKRPWYNEDGRILGVIGLTTDLSSLYIMDTRVDITLREFQVIALKLIGLSSKTAASYLFISPRTVEVYLKNIRIKLGITSHKELIKIVIRNNKLGLRLYTAVN